MTAHSRLLSRRRLAAAVATAAALAVTATLAPAATAADTQPPGAAKAAAPARTADVMTRNLYLGASLDLIVGALSTGNVDLIKQAATITWGQVQASDPEERMAAVADEIVAERPAVVGLQEVTRWTTYDVGAGGVTPTVRYDFLDLLIDELAERGMTYHEVEGATANNFSSDPIPVDAMPTVAVSIQDRDVILRRDDVKAWNAHNGNFQTILGPPSFPIAIDRGWGSADVRTRLATFRVVNAHTEAFGPEIIRIGEVMELFAAQDAITEESGALPTVYLGDYNTAAPKYDESGAEIKEADGAYEVLRTRLADTWVDANGTDNGFTCCQAPLLDNPMSELSQRIDFVFTQGAITTKSSRIVGDTPVDLPGETYWASDHAGVVSTIVVGQPAPKARTAGAKKARR